MPFSPLDTHQFLGWSLETALVIMELLSAFLMWPDDGAGMTLRSSRVSCVGGLTRDEKSWPWGRDCLPHRSGSIL